MQRTLKRELKVPEIVEKETIEISACTGVGVQPEGGGSSGCVSCGLRGRGLAFRRCRLRPGFFPPHRGVNIGSAERVKAMGKVSRVRPAVTDPWSRYLSLDRGSSRRVLFGAGYLSSRVLPPGGTVKNSASRTAGHDGGGVHKRV
jgi:hypothetical protein